jgi:hypothetical protein
MAFQAILRSEPGNAKPVLLQRALPQLLWLSFGGDVPSTVTTKLTPPAAVVQSHDSASLPAEVPWRYVFCAC